MAPLRKKRELAGFRRERFFRHFRRNSSALFCSGNRVHFYKNGGEFNPALFDAIANAREHVCLQFYIIRDDSTGRRFAKALVDAAARGVKVYLIYDYIGCFDTPASYFGRLQRYGIKCLPFNPPAFSKLAMLDRRNHRKFAVIDGKTGFVAGLNIADEYSGFGESPKRWRDVGMKIDGIAAGELQRLFQETWREEGRVMGRCSKPADFSSDGGAEVIIVSGAPHHTRSAIGNAFRLAIAGASRSIRIITPYFVPGPRVIRSLLRAAARGTQVQIIVPAISDVPLVRLVSRSFYTPLLRAGIQIYERLGTVLHAKVMLIDDSWVTIGSANLDLRSFHRNYELNVAVDDYEFGRQVYAMFEEDLALSRRVTLQEHEARGFLCRILERVLSPMRWYL